MSNLNSTSKLTEFPPLEAEEKADGKFSFSKFMFWRKPGKLMEISFIKHLYILKVKYIKIKIIIVLLKMLVVLQRLRQQASMLKSILKLIFMPNKAGRTRLKISAEQQSSPILQEFRLVDEKSSQVPTVLHTADLNPTCRILHQIHHLMAPSHLSYSKPEPYLTF